MNNDKTIIKLLVTDMDGTFLNSASAIPAENIASIRRLKETGIDTVICTGRTVSFVGEYVKQAGVSPVVIGCNGAVIYDTSTGKFLHFTEIEKETVRRLLDFSLTQKLDVCAYTVTGDVYFSETSKRVSVFRTYNDKLTQTNSSERPVPLIELEKNVEHFFNEQICKFLITSKTEGDLQGVWDFLRTIKNIYTVPSMSNVIDIMAAGVSKGQGVQKLAEAMKLSLSEICVVGDNKNDIPMFEVAGVSVCMANGDAETKKHATFVTTKTNDEGGFVEAVKMLQSKYRNPTV